MNVFFVIYAVIGVVHILTMILEKDLLRGITKTLIIPPLAAAYIAAKGFDLPIAALVFGWLGDILLLNHGKKKYLILGLVSFLLGHLCYIAVFVRYIELFNVPAFLVSCGAAALFSVMAFRCVRPPANMVFPVIVYMAVIESMALAGLQLVIPGVGFAAGLIFGGCLCFIISDLTLGYYTFRPRPKYAGLAIMLLYILAQGGITLGLTLLSP